MSRPKTLVRMSLRGRDGVTVKIGFAPQADGRWAVYRDERRSVKTPSLNATQVGRLVAKWLRRQSAVDTTVGLDALRDLNKTR